ALTLNQVVTVFTDGSTASGAIPSTIGNPSLKPERTAEIEAGLDGSLLSERLSLEVTYYHRRSRDALVQYPLPWEVAVPFQWRNIAAVLNYGVEGQVTLTVLNRPALAWDLSLNGSV